MKSVLRATMAACFVVGSVSALAAPITITSSSYTARAHDRTSGSDTDRDSTTNYGTKSIFAETGGNSAAGTAVWTDTGSGATFDFNAELVRTGAQYDFAQTYESSLYFTAGLNTTYDMSGYFNVDDVTTAGQSYVQAFLQNTSTGQMLFRDITSSQNTVDESFTLGVAGDGDSSNTTLGSLSGNLAAGQNYRFFFNMYTRAIPDADGGASATGNINLTIGTSSVPAPAPLVLFGLGLLTMGLRRTQR